MIWDHLSSFWFIWNQLEPFETNCDNLEQLGTMWYRLAEFEIQFCQFGTIWNHLEPLINFHFVLSIFSIIHYTLSWRAFYPFECKIDIFLSRPPPPKKWLLKILVPQWSSKNRNLIQRPKNLASFLSNETFFSLTMLLLNRNRTRLAVV